jgi:hypothetical protein
MDLGSPESEIRIWDPKISTDREIADKSDRFELGLYCRYHSLITELTIAVISYQNPKYPTIKNFEDEVLKH